MLDTICLLLVSFVCYPELMQKGGAVISWLVCSFPDRAVRVRALAGDIVLCFGQDALLSQCLSPSANLMLGATL